MEAPTPLRDLHWTPLEGPGLFSLRSVCVLRMEPFCMTETVLDYVPRVAREKLGIGSDNSHGEISRWMWVRWVQ